MAEMAVLVDVSRCTGCRGCQVACKQWNKNPASETCFTGTYENPPELQWNTFTRVKFNEFEEGGKLAWLFSKVQCRHCVEPACRDACPVEGAIVRHDNGAVVVDQDKCVGGADGKCKLECGDDVCPYEIPCFLPESPKNMKKCTFCLDRQAAGKKPACVSACLSGALFFGTRKEVLDKAKERLKELKKKYPGAHLLDDAEDVGWVYLLLYPKEKYGLAFNPEKVRRKFAHA